MPGSAILFPPLEYQILGRMLDPTVDGVREIAFRLGITPGTLKVYLSRIYDRLGWTDGSHRKLALWAVAYADQLGMKMPSRRSFGSRRL